MIEILILNYCIVYHWSVTKVFPSWIVTRSYRHKVIRHAVMKYSSYGHKIIQHVAFLSQNHVLAKPILLFLNYRFSKSSNQLIRIVNIYGCSNVTKFNIKNQLNLKMSSKKCLCNHKWMGKTQVLKNTQPRKKKHWSLKNIEPTKSI